MKTLEWLLVGSLILNAGCSMKYANLNNEKEKGSIEVISNEMNKDADESEGIVSVINYHYNAALEGKEPKLRCPPEYEDFKICLIDGAYCLAEKKFDFAIKNFEQALIEAKKLNKKVDGVLYYFLGFSYQNADSLDKALNCYKESLEMNKKIGYENGQKMAEDAIKKLLQN